MKGLLIIRGTLDKGNHLFFERTNILKFLTPQN